MKNESNSWATAFAKTTRPELGNIVPREALFQCLDGTLERTVVWISGPAGAGKSTLAASYVEARGYPSAWFQFDPDDEDVASFFHYLGYAARRIVEPGTKLPPFDALRAVSIAAYSRKFFRQLFSQVKPPAVLVLDNLNNLPSDSPLRVALEAGLAQVPRRCCVIVTSRDDPPVALARMRASGEMVAVDADDLRITIEEIGKIGDLRGKPVDADAALRLHERTQGWAAGVVLMLEHAKLSGRIAELPDDATPRVVFDYLAGEIFERFEGSTQQFLLRIACLPRVTLEVAQELSGDANAGRLLLNLAHNDYFVREVVGNGGRIFQFHPLLRDFLLNRAALELPDAVSGAALVRAAALLRHANQVEDAVSLLIAAKSWPEVAAIATDLAGEMLSQGRRETLAGWLELLPPEVLNCSPALLCAIAACRLYASPRTARHQFEKGLAGYRHTGDAEGMIRACCGIIDATILEFDDLASLDDWISELLTLVQSHPMRAAGAAAALIRALLLRDPASPALREWLGIAASATSTDRRIAEALPRTAVARAMAALLQGDFAGADAIAGGIVTDSGDTATRIGASLVTALHHFLDGEYRATQEHANAGLATGDAEGIHAYDGWLHTLLAAAALGMADGDRARAELELLDTMTLRRGDRAIVHYLRGWQAAIAADVVVAQREMRSALILATEAGIPWMEWFARVAMAQVFGVAGNRVEAGAQIRSAVILAEHLASPILKVATLLAEAGTTIESVDDPAALARLRTAFSLGREHGFRHVVGLMPALVAELCAAALRNDVECEFARTLIREALLAPPASALRLKQWPWRFQIGTLGGFSLRREDGPIEFSAKGPGRPVELLKVLVALGGQNVRADQLADALWPHVDADYAHKSFTATLHRLRQIFRDDEALTLRDGRLSLNPASFWVDTWALDKLLADMDARLRHPNLACGEAAVHGFLDELFALYRGPFLPDESEQPGFIACREQLRARVLRVINRMARRWEEAGHHEAAVDCYVRGIDADEICEAYHRNLMQCYQRQGDIAEALATFNRLRTILATRLRSMPSPETEAVYASLRGVGGAGSPD